MKGPMRLHHYKEESLRRCTKGRIYNDLHFMMLIQISPFSECPSTVVKLISEFCLYETTKCFGCDYRRFSPHFVYLSTKENDSFVKHVHDRSLLFNPERCFACSVQMAPKTVPLPRV